MTALLSRHYDVDWRHYRFIRVSKPLPWASAKEAHGLGLRARKPMPRSWLQLAARIAAIFAGLCAGAYLILGK